MAKVKKEIEKEIIKEVHEEFKKEQAKEKSKEEMHKQVKREVHHGLTFAVFLICIMLAGGTIFFHYFEGWSWVDSFYFSGSTITTLGYGDLVPTHDITKVVVVFYTLFTLGLVLYSVSIISSRIIERAKVIKLVQRVRAG